MNGRGRPEKLTDDLKRWITKRQGGHKKKKLKAPIIHNDMRCYIEAQVRDDVKKRGLDWSEDLILSEVEERLPGVSAIQKYLQELNPRLDKPLPKDYPWHLGTLDDYPLPVEAIPHILKVQTWLEQHDGGFPLSTSFDWGVEVTATEQGEKIFHVHETVARGLLTIRQAQWISRLYVASRDLSFKQAAKFKNQTQEKTENFVIFNLWYQSQVYADYERVCEIAKVVGCDTIKLDKGLRDGDFEDAAFDNQLNSYDIEKRKETANNERTHNKKR